ncbi:MAG TPA: PSD1 and planctomycete cytochrome C domain-containing protein [Planctomycetota bacterium]|nr:PSD1 and planctomycete cytochrome C domain-containing protein [Planctomycetota bacterium]
MTTIQGVSNSTLTIGVGPGTDRMSTRFNCLRPLLLSLLVWTAAAALASSPKDSAPIPETIQFNRDVRPILSENCFNCHGPDKNSRKAKLRLDTYEGATTDLDGNIPVVPGKLEKSELYKRVISKDPEEVMPPPKSEHKLSPRQIGILKKWIEQGAKWEKHWAFIAPVQPPVPKPGFAGWTKNPIDAFLAARLEQEGLKPSPEAPKHTLIRRATLDLTGLPPTPQEVDAFLADNSPDAYEKLVDRLLASPHYGERMALDWLDVARYADTNGYHIDNGRDMTRWREWVIEAFNTNKPFDQFTIEQLAGDLLPNATIDQQIASGFNRNHMINFEGGAIPEEYHTAYIVDRVNTTTTVWMGLTVACAQCHDHKYDPITQKEFYQLYAFFNNVPEKGLDGNKGNSEPMIKTPTREQQAEIDRHTALIRELEAKLTGPMPEVDAAQAKWEESEAGNEAKVDWSVLEAAEMKSAGGATLAKADDHSVRATGTNPASDTFTFNSAAAKEVTAIRLEALPDDALNAKGPGRSENGNFVMTSFKVSAEGKAVKIKSATADFSQKDFPITSAIDTKPGTGWAIHPEVGKAHTAVFELDKALPAGTPLSITLEFKSQFGQHVIGRFRLSATDAKNPQGSKTPENIRAIIALAADKRSDAQKAELRSYYRSTHSNALKEINAQIASEKKTLAELEKKITTTMVMKEMPQPRETFMLMRGQYNNKGEKVTAATPASLPPFPADAPKNRLGFAKWLVDPAHPLASRVTVNRYWQMYFGTGLVKTSEDFGSQGELPSHQDLLDWLATEFIRTGWDIKKLQRLIVTSAAYKQSTAVTPELLTRDAENRLLARGARHRLQAEFIRDQALAASGLLNRQIGGQSVSPYQPPGLWEELMSRSDGKNWTAQTYVQSHGPDLYRRTMYTFWKRTSPPPSLNTFDAPDRETCTVRRARTNTPLQALVLMNDPTYVEASRKLAERLMTEGGASAADRITLGFRLVTARKPSDKERAVLQRIFDQQLAVYSKNKDAATKLLTVGESPRNEKLDVSELAAWTVVANTLLNLDETVTRN